jgi:cytochrome c
LRNFNRVSLPAFAGAMAIALAGLGAMTVPAQAADGEKLFKRCVACHTLEEGKNKVGPSLAGVVGRTAGTAPAYKYSALNQAAGAAGLVWTEENIVAYLPDPSAFLTQWLKDNGAADQAKGRSKMTFRMPKEADRQAVAEFLASQGK